jgi:DNA-binding GntR family transcriptional regulator
MYHACYGRFPPAARSAAAGPLVPQPWSSLGKIAYEAIVEGILTGVLPAGSQISIDRTAKQLNMSNTPVREALSRLAAERLVLFSANRGYTVTPQIAAGEYRQLFEARRTLELAAIQLLANYSTWEHDRFIDPAIRYFAS